MVATCRAIVKEVVGHGVEEQDRKRTWMADAGGQRNKGEAGCCRAWSAATAARHAQAAGRASALTGSAQETKRVLQAHWSISACCLAGARVPQAGSCPPPRAAPAHPAEQRSACGGAASRRPAPSTRTRCLSSRARSPSGGAPRSLRRRTAAGRAWTRCSGRRCSTARRPRCFGSWLPRRSGCRVRGMRGGGWGEEARRRSADLPRGSTGVWAPRPAIPPGTCAVPA